VLVAGSSPAGPISLLHRLSYLPRKDFLDGDGLELVALAFFAEEIIERGEFGGGTDCFLLPRHIGFLHFSNSRLLRRAKELRLGKPGRVKRAHQKRLTSLFIAMFQPSAN